MIKRLSFLLTILILFETTSTAQNFEENWTDYFSYVSVQDISQGDDRIFVGAENAIFIYDLITQQITTLTSVQGLAGESITAIHYSPSTNLLTIGYQNGLIEVVNFDDEDQVLKVVDILDKQSIPPNRKRINHFTEFEGNLYISAGFGISVYSLSALEFGDSYIIGDLGAQIDITQTTIDPPFIYASSSEGGIRRAILEDDNIIDYQIWETLTSGNYFGVQLLGTQIFAAQNNIVFRVDGAGIFNQVASYPSTIQDFGVNNSLLTITTTNAIRAYEQGFILRASVTGLPEFDYQLQTGYSFDNFFYMGTSLLGLLRVPFDSNQAEQILPDGPLLNNPFAIDATPGQLWVSFGDLSVDFNPFPLSQRGISNLRNGEWNNFSYSDLLSSVGASEVTDIVNVTINPNNPEEVYFSSFNNGLLKVENGEPSILFNETNSSLELTIVDDYQGIRIYGSDFDREGNLWFVQSLTDQALIRLSPNDQFQKIDVSEISDGSDQLAFSEVAVSREGFVFFGAVGTGVIGYNPNSGAFRALSEGDGSGGLPGGDVRALAFDNNNRLWIGVLGGLRVLGNPGGIFANEEQAEAQSIIFADDEGVGQELLFEQNVIDIEVDGSNNKWVATANSGVFYLSPNGQETLLRFTSENSPLPSNNVQDISIDSFTGVVYFATVNGLVAYNGTATAPRENLEEVFAFPNPVRPGFQGNVTIDGLTQGANVKITDIEGNLVYQQTSEGGSVLWDTTAFGRYKVVSGVYLVIITAEDALETIVKKIMVVR